MNPDTDINRSLNWNGKNDTPNSIARTNHLLVIGIDEYEHWPRLNNAVRDGKAFRDLLWELYDFSEANTVFLENKNATKYNILDTLRDFEQDGSRKLTTTDNLLIYYAGHGGMNPKRTTGFWIPVNAASDLRRRHEFLSNIELKESLEHINAHHIYIISDACFAGSIITRAGIGEKLYEDKPSRRVLTSGQLEKVLDGTPGGNSPFAETLLECLKKPSDNLLSQEVEALLIRNFINKLEKQGQILPDNQRPTASHLDGIGDEGGQFIFRPRNASERHWNEAAAQNTIASYVTYIRRYRLTEQNLESERVMEALSRLETIKENKKIPTAELNRLKITVGEKDVLIAELKKENAALKNQIQIFEKDKEGVKIKSSAASPANKSKFPIPEMVLINGGTFIMGSDEDDSEKPPHKVTLGDFYIGKYAVTFEEYDAYCEVMDIPRLGDYKWGRGKRPIIGISWFEATHYCDWLSIQTGETWRLPTEAQWEYAAGGGSEKLTRFAGTDNKIDIGKYAWHKGNSGGKTHTVQGRLSNSLGLYDMSGNIWEWCIDWYDKYPSSDIYDPTGPETGVGRVLRGGGWDDNAEYCRVSYRGYSTPGLRFHDLGFRVVRTN